MKEYDVKLTKSELTMLFHVLTDTCRKVERNISTSKNTVKKSIWITKKQMIKAVLYKIDEARNYDLKNRLYNSLE